MGRLDNQQGLYAEFVMMHQSPLYEYQREFKFDTEDKLSR